MDNRLYMPNNKYKPGDCAVFVGDNARFHGRRCTIVSIDTLHSIYPIYWISFDDDSGNWLCNENLLRDIFEDENITPEDIDLLL